LGLTQTDVAVLFDTTMDSVRNWEIHRNAPDIRLRPKIHDFLGYALYIYITSLSRKIRLFRESLGLSQKELAQQAGVTEGSLVDWEAGRCSPKLKSKDALEAYFSQRFEAQIKLA